jgi:uncharacterized membrane protein YhaH (DUF805 family)
MIRLLLPKLSFSGRLNRAGFWREITISAITTPIAVAIVTYLAHEGARAAEHGLVVDNVRAKAIVGLLLSFYALRNTLVFFGVIRRRLNDLGLEGTRVFKPAVPLLLFFGISFIVTLIGGAPPGGEKQLAIGLLSFALVALLLWQILRAANVGFQVMFGPSGALADGQPAPRLQDAMSAPMSGDIQQAVAGLRGRFDTVMKDLRTSAGGKPNGFEAIDKLFAPAIDTLNNWANAAPAKTDPTASGKVRHDRRGAWERAKREPPVQASREAGWALAARANAGKVTGKAVIVARHEPKTGRSRWYSGLLTGPWG